MRIYNEDKSFVIIRLVTACGLVNSLVSKGPRKVIPTQVIIETAYKEVYRNIL